MGGVLTLALLLALVLPRHWRAPLLLGGLVASTLVLALWWENIMIYKRDRHHEASQAAESAQLRPILARIAWEMFLSRPLLGCGYAQYQYEHRNFTGDRTTELPLEKGRGYVQHNVLLAMLTENGLVGLGLFLALLARWGRDAWKLWHGERAPLWARQLGLLFLLALGAYLVNGMFHDVALVPLANMTLFFLAGLTTAARWQVLQPPASSA
jgi:O-antigen ligase